MSESSVTPKTPSVLEVLNKQLAREQVREINKGLTRLKTISFPPPANKELDTDKTGKFITVPLSPVQADTLESAYVEAEKTCSDSDLELKAKKKKRWFNWSK